MEENKFERGQVWLWYKDVELVDVFIIEKVTTPHGVPLMYVHGMEDPVSTEFFSDMELMSSINDIAMPEEKEMVLAEMKRYGLKTLTDIANGKSTRNKTV